MILTIDPNFRRDIQVVHVRERGPHGAPSKRPLREPLVWSAVDPYQDSTMVAIVYRQMDGERFFKHANMHMKIHNICM